MTARAAVVRPEGRSERLLSALTAEGLEPVVVVPYDLVPDPASFPDLAAAVDVPGWLVLTSVAGLDAVVAARGQAPPEARVAVVGDATAAAVRRLGWTVHHVAEGTAADLAAGLPAEPGDRVTAPLSERARSDLADGLADRGIDLAAVVAYSPVDRAWTDDERSAVAACDVALLTAPSILDRLAAEIDLVAWVAAGGGLVAIGPTTSAAVEARGLPLAARAARPDVVALAAAAADWVRARRSRGPSS